MKIKVEQQVANRLPALWEWGGLRGDIGDAVIIAGPQGESLAPVYTRSGPHTACSEHALFIVQKGYLVVRATHRRGNFVIRVYRITEINEREIILREEYVFCNGKWAPEAPKGKIMVAVGAARLKALCLDCSGPFYARRPLKEWAAPT